MKTKYIVLVPDGMADYPIEELGGRTPLEAAKTPNMDFIAHHGRLGRVQTVPPKMAPGSDVANITIMGYDTRKFYTGRGPLEAANLGVELGQGDVAFRANLVTISDDKLVDYSAGHIHSKEAGLLIDFIDKKIGTDRIKFYPGVSYRHLMVVKNGVDLGLQDVKCTPPHDITGKNASKYLPKGKGSEFLLKIMQDSFKILPTHEINLVRVDLKENPANMIWLWGQGEKPAFPKMTEKYGITGSIISAVDLLKGLGRIIGLDVIDVAGATGYYDTDYLGKAKAAINSLENNDFVFVHVEAPDEAGHNGDLREKITAIERFDQMIVGTILNKFKDKDGVRILLLPDHATPVSLRTHVADPVCFAAFGKGIEGRGFKKYCEKEAMNSDLYIENGHELMDLFIKGGL